MECRALELFSSIFDGAESAGRVESLAALQKKKGGAKSGEKVPGQFHTVASLVLNFRELVPRGQTKLKRPIVLLRASLLGA